MIVKGLMSCLWSDPPGLTVGFLALVWSSFEIISLNKRESWLPLLLLCSSCHVAVSVYMPLDCDALE